MLDIKCNLILELWVIWIMNKCAKKVKFWKFTKCIRKMFLLMCTRIYLIWSNFMRTHTGLTIFVLLGVKKIWKTRCFLGPLFYGRSVVLIDVFCYSCGFKRYHFLHFFRTPCKTKIVLKYCPNKGQNYGCQISS